MRMIDSFNSAPMWLGASLLIAGAAHAGENFQVRYNLAGSLGGEMFAQPGKHGLAVGLAATHISINKTTGPDGKQLQAQVPGGTVALPAPARSALYPSYSAQSIPLSSSGDFDVFNLGVAYVTEEQHQGGRIAVAFNLPIGRKTQVTSLKASTPALQWKPAVPPSTRGVVENQFNSRYQSNLQANAAANSGEVQGIGDAEIQAGWLYATEKLRLLAGVSLVAPTGDYDSGAGPDIGAGQFYTLRPAIQVGYLFNPEVAVAGKLTLGINSRNTDNDLRSGNWVGIEAAAAYKTRIGALGIHGIHVQQIQDDSNNPWGSSRFRSSNVGAFFTTLLPALGSSLTLQHMQTVNSRNAKSGRFTQVRLIKLF